MIGYVVLDLDGVVYRGGEACPGAREGLSELRRMGLRLGFFTNNSTRHRASVAELLNGLGIEAQVDEVCTSGRLAGLYLAQRFPEARVFVIGEFGLVEELREAGVQLAAEASEADTVVVGMDRAINYTKLREAHVAVVRGARFIATNRDPCYPVEGGLTWPGAGSLVAALETSTGVKPIELGKPSPLGLQTMAEQWRCRPEEMLAVGDRLDTDVRSARAFGCTSVIVLTGVTSRSEAENATPEERRPDYIIGTLAELPGLIRSLR